MGETLDLVERKGFSFLSTQIIVESFTGGGFKINQNFFRMAPWNKALKLMTSMVLLIMGGLVIVAPPFSTNILPHLLSKEVYRYLCNNVFIEGVEGYFASGLATCVILLSYLFSPRGYSLDDRHLTIKRLVGGISIPYSQILAVEIVENVKFSLRVFGVGGVFSWYGSFLVESGSNSGIAKVYATSFRRMARIETGKRTYYLSPAEPEKFVEAVKERLN
jgi:hypothetical protein